MSDFLRIEDIHKSFGKNHVLKGVTFNIPNGSICGMIGPSGSGKSILLKIIGGVVRANQGNVHLPADAVAEEDHSRTISLMFQEGALFDSMTVFDNVAFPLVHGSAPCANLPLAERQEVAEKVFAVLARVGLSKASFKMPAQLSGGMRRRVSLARALVAKPRIVLLDDPTSGLDPVASSVIMNLIAEMHKDYKPTMLLVSHDLRRLFPLVESIYALFDGRICFCGSLEDLKACEHSLLRTFAACRYDMVA